MSLTQDSGFDTLQCIILSLILKSQHVALRKTSTSCRAERGIQGLLRPSAWLGRQLAPSTLRKCAQSVLTAPFLQGKV